MPQKEELSSVGPAAISGAIQAVLFNPVDRALYLRVHHRRAFFHPENWTHPFQGFGNAALYRTISAGSYWFWQDHSRYQLSHYFPDLETHPAFKQFLVGVMAGAANAMALNQLQIIKFHTWARNSEFSSTAIQMYKDAGMRIFFRGVTVSISRDVAFGIAYEMLRMPHRTKQYGERVEFAGNCFAATVASIGSAPFNYCRTIVYGSPASSCPLPSYQLLFLLSRETTNQHGWMNRFHYLNSRLNVGWGSVRVGVGMAVGQWVFGYTKRVFGRSS